MARDYRPRQPNAQMLQSHSQRQKQAEVSKSKRNILLVMVLVFALLLGGYWIVDHFVNSGLKSGSTANIVAVNDEDDEPETLSVDRPDVVVNPSPVQEKISKAVVEQPKFVSEPLETPNKTVITKPEEVVKDSAIHAEALPVPEDASIYDDPKIDFYNNLKAIEVVPDDTTPVPVALEKPKYILAGSFFSEAAAQRSLSRLASHGQKLKMRVSVRKDGKKVYALYTDPYYNRLKLNKRKNQLRKLGVGVLELEYKSAAKE